MKEKKLTKLKKRYQPNKWLYESKYLSISNKRVSEMSTEELQQAVCRLVDSLCKIEDHLHDALDLTD